MDKNEKYWINRKLDWEKAYWNLDHPHRQKLIGVLKKYNFGKVLEIGCGCGANLFLIKKEFPWIKVAGCDINRDAIRTAKERFAKNEIPPADKEMIHSLKPEEKNLAWIDKMANKINLREPELPDVDFKVANATELPFHGASFDLVVTDACLIYLSPEKMDRAIREIRRVAARGGAVAFTEFHSKNPLKRLALRLSSRYYSYNYEKLLQSHLFKGVKTFKISEEEWPGGNPWREFGYLITAII